MKTNKYFSIQMIVEAGLSIALAYILSLFKVYEMPYGGSITLSMLPLMIFSIRWGMTNGFIIGILYGILSLIIKPQVVHPIQVLLDYPLPSAFIGLSGYSYLKDKTKLQGYIPSIIIAYVLKFACHFLAGVVFYGQYAPKGLSPAYYSFVYNIQYTGPELILFLIVIALLWSPLKSLRIKQY